MSETPWNSIAESIIELPDGPLNYQAALASPCETCATSPCCTALPLHTFRITNMTELDHAIYLLNFDRIELGLSANGDWSVYYRYPCRFLDRQSFNCTIHEQPQQPSICRHYNPYHCWYKRVFTSGVSDNFLRIDRERMEYVVSQVVFNQDRTIAEVPDWDNLTEAFGRMSLTPPKNGEGSAVEIESVAQPDVWIDLENVQVQAQDPSMYVFDELTDPCGNCPAYCCHTLVFPAAPPATLANLDYYQFCLGFPGVELGVTDGEWAIIVKTTCRHLQGNRCALYGKPERPQICRYYDEFKCTYKVNFGQAQPDGFLTVNLDRFQWLAESFPMDSYGQVLELPPVALLRAHFEEQQRSAQKAA